MIKRIEKESKILETFRQRALVAEKGRKRMDLKMAFERVS